jgi:hypothetical protein
MSLALRAAVIGLLVAASPAAAVTNLIVNGDFEAPGFGGTATYVTVPPIPSDFGWSVPVNAVDIIANGVFAPFLPTGGLYNLDLVAIGSTGAISQTFATVLGKTYTLSIDFSQNGQASRSADVVLDSTTLTTLVSNGPWQTWSTTFVGTGAPTTLLITEVIGGNSAGVALDNISVTAVPEPATWAMLITGFGMVGYGLRRRRATVTA